MIILRLTLTALLVIGAVSGGIGVWRNVFEYPWTRDAHIRADIVEVAPQISGQITEIAVASNRHVKKGDPLLYIEITDYRLAVQMAEAQLAVAAAQSASKQEVSRRLSALHARQSAAISDRDVATAQLDTQAAEALERSARVSLSRARTDLQRTTVFAPVSGYVTNLTADTGEYAVAGKPLLAIVDDDSFRVDAFFMETALPLLKEGDVARVKLMASGETLAGQVTGISSGISYGQDSSDGLLQNPSASFEWIRLAQRVPVEIALTDASALVPLVNGTTVSVIVEVPQERRRGWSEAFLSAWR